MVHELDDVDREILHLIQENARISNSRISEVVGVSPSTVGKRLDKLESSGVIKGYRPDIDYDEAGYPLRILFICSIPISDRHDFIQDLLELPGIVGVRELMTGRNNVHIETVGKHNDDITALASVISDLGIQINEEVLVKNEYPKPASIFIVKEASHLGFDPSPS